MIVPALAALLALGPGIPPGPGALHDIHASHTRLVIEGTSVACRVRVFHDDLQLALRALAQDSTLTVGAGHTADQLFQRYFAEHVKVEADGRPVSLRVTAAGLEVDAADQQVIWYVLEGELQAPLRRLVLRQGLFFELYEDQQNIVQLLKLPGEERRTLHFAGSDPRDQSLSF